MLITRTNPVGLDLYVQKLQTSIYNRLSVPWAASADTYKAYGRCYRNKTDNGYIAENYEGSGEYREVYWDDSLKAISFFGLSGRADFTDGPGANANLHLVFFVNLAKVAPSVTHRADEEVRRQVLGAVGRNAFGFAVESVELWIENVLREYPGSRRENRLAAVDMHPIHCFRVNLSLAYDPNKTC